MSRDAILLQPSLRDSIMFHDVPRTKRPGLSSAVPSGLNSENQVDTQTKSPHQPQPRWHGFSRALRLTLSAIDLNRKKEGRDRLFHPPNPMVREAMSA